MYPITYEADYEREPSRLTTFFRLILAIPWLIVGYVYTLVAEIATLIAWFALVILGRYPEWAYDFVSGVLRYNTRVTAWLFLQTDQFPPFGISPDPTYPVRVNVAPNPDHQSRLKALFRIILVLPLIILYYLMIYVHGLISVISWLTILFRGYQPAGVHNALVFTNSWMLRFQAYAFLLTDRYPPVGAEGPQVGDVPAAAIAPSAPPPAVPAPEPEAPQPPEQSQGS
jgi:hypothetical protein